MCLFILGLAAGVVAFVDYRVPRRQLSCIDCLKQRTRHFHSPEEMRAFDQAGRARTNGQPLSAPMPGTA